MDTLTIEAPSVAAFAAILAGMPHETRANVTATEHGTPWATVTVAPHGETHRAVFPNFLQSGAVGDSRKRGQCGVGYAVGDPAETAHALRVVIDRARRMATL